MNPASSTKSFLSGSILSAIRRLDAVPYSALAIPLRAALGWVFWSSALVHLASWETTLALFSDEYKVPLLPPGLAATLGVAVEVAAPLMLAFGLGTRLAAAALLGMTTVIEVFVYPQAWPTHIQWAAMALVLLCRGGGRLSADHMVRRAIENSMGSRDESEIRAEASCLEPGPNSGRSERAPKIPRDHTRRTHDR